MTDAVKGYRDLTEANVATVNRNKEMEERVLRALDDLPASLDVKVDPRWLAIGRSQIEQGFMAVNRSIFQPGRVSLPEDQPVPGPWDKPAATPEVTA